MVDENAFQQHQNSKEEQSVKDLDVVRKQKLFSHQTSVNLRKKKTQELLAKLRTNDFQEDPAEAQSQNDGSFFEQNNKANSTTLSRNMTHMPTSAEFDIVASEAEKLSGQELYEKIQFVRKMISNPSMRKIKPGAFIDAIIQSRFMYFITQTLAMIEDENTCYEITWIMINIAAGTSNQTAHVVSSGAFDILLKKLNLPISINLKDQILWCVANVIGDGADLRNIAMRKGILNIIHTILADPLTTLQSIKHNIAWILSNILRPAEAPVEDFELEVIYEMISKLIAENPTDSNIIYDSIWALVYSLSRPERKTSLIVKGFDIFLLNQLSTIEERVPKAALRALTLLSTGLDSDVQTLIDHNMLDVLAEVFEKRSDSFKQEIYVIFGNVALGDLSQKYALIHHRIFPSLLNGVPEMNEKVQREAFFMVAHLLDTKDKDFLLTLIRNHENTLPVFFLSLRKASQEWHLVERNLYALETLLAHQSIFNMDIALMLEEDGALSSIEAYQTHCPENIYTRVGEIIDKYFSSEGQEEKNLDPSIFANQADGNDMFDF